MKKMTLIIYALTLPVPLFGLIGRCIDDSKHLKERYDNKEYHFVRCYCDCSDTLKECPKCGHKRMAQKKFIISTPQSALKAGSAIEQQKKDHTTIVTDPRAILTALVKRKHLSPSSNYTNHR